MPEHRYTIRSLTRAEALGRQSELVDVLVDCVEGGASVNFMLPFSRDKAERFWLRVIESLGREERILLVAEDPEGIIMGTVQVVIDQPENQPHRADVSKMLVHRRGRRTGVGGALMQAAEDAARNAGKTLLVLDTATPEADRLYRRAGWTPVGVIPGYALLPDGRPCDTTFFYKSLVSAV